jgi:hypothetical protein
MFTVHRITVRQMGVHWTKKYTVQNLCLLREGCYQKLAPPIFSSGACDLAKLRLAPYAQLDTLELAISFKIWETER